MGLDLRWPIGLMFSIIGVLLTITGIASGAKTEMTERSLGININLWWGIVLLIFGGFMLLLAMRGGKPAAGDQPAAPTNPENPKH